MWRGLKPWRYLFVFSLFIYLVPFVRSYGLCINVSVGYGYNLLIHFFKFKINLSLVHSVPFYINA